MTTFPRLTTPSASRASSEFGRSLAFVPDALVARIRAADITPPPPKRGDVMRFTDAMLIGL